MYLTIYEQRIRRQQDKVNDLANKYHEIEARIAKVITEIDGEWCGSGADAQIEKLRAVYRDAESTRSQLLTVSASLNNFCITHRTVWERIVEEFNKANGRETSGGGSSW